MKKYRTYYKSPLGRILLESEENHLTGLWFENSEERCPDPADQKTENSEWILGEDGGQTHDIDNKCMAVKAVGHAFQKDGKCILGSINIPTVIIQAEKWLDIYFSGHEPDFMPEIRLEGTDFQMLIWKLLLDIPYGQTVTYGEIARQAAKILGKERMSAQAVGGAVGKNPVSIIVPCHRVVGTGGKLTGYGGGIERKAALLELEKISD